MSSNSNLYEAESASFSSATTQDKSSSSPVSRSVSKALKAVGSASYSLSYVYPSSGKKIPKLILEYKSLHLDFYLKVQPQHPHQQIQSQFQHQSLQHQDPYPLQYRHLHLFQLQYQLQLQPQPHLHLHLISH